MRFKPQQLGKNVRMNFATVKDVLQMPDFLDVQKKSYKWLLEKGIMEVLKESSPVVDNTTGNLSIEYIDFTFDGNSKHSVSECKDRSLNYAAPFNVKVRLTNKETGEATEQIVYMGDIPLMTEQGSFVINGAQRVVVSQIVRSPGMYYKIKNDPSSPVPSFTAQVIPYRGAWLEYETDMSGIFYVKIDKNKKIPITVLIRALEESKSTDDGVISLFGNDPIIDNTLKKDGINFLCEKRNSTPYAESLKFIYERLRPGDPATVESALSVIQNLLFDARRYDLGAAGRYKFDQKAFVGSRLVGKKLTRDMVSPFTGEIVFEAGKVVSEDDLRTIEQNCVNEAYIEVKGEKEPIELKVFGNGMVNAEDVLGYDLVDCGIKEKVSFKVLMSVIEECDGDAEMIKRACTLRAGELSPRHITKDDIFASINYLVCLTHGVGTEDDIDHLGNRRIRSVGELIQNQMRIGFARMQKTIPERLVSTTENLTPRNVINTRPFNAAMKEFFGSSQLSQFMDENNPLAEIAHKRRISALGPGGISRDRASFDVRDVHYTHYGRICPIETPEGPNIGLISYLAMYAKINDYGFIEAPYRKIEKVKKVDENGNEYVCGKVTDEIVYITADVEDKYVVAQANEKLNPDGTFARRMVTARERAEIVEVRSDVPDLMDVSPRMLISVSAGFIPFLENDDNSRALMGSNMQKQAVPLMVTSSPIVGTGLEYKAAVDSRSCVISEVSGTVIKSTGDEIQIRTDEGEVVRYTLMKFKRSNAGNCINQHNIINVGDRVEKGDVIADGSATSNGEIALGKNALIGFMTWEGYNYEDAVLLNENLVRNDVYTSIHIADYEIEARETKIGKEEITCELPQVSKESLANLDEEGIVRIGTEVHAGDILVGKVSPKGETDPTPEEKLLRAIFGEKTRDVKNTSLTLPHGESGIVVDVKVFSRENNDELDTGVIKKVRVYVAQKRKISVGDKMAGRHGNKGVVSRILPPEDMPYLEDGTPLDIVLNPLGVPSRMNIGQVLEVHLGIAARELGFKVMTPSFDGAKESDITELMKEAKLYREVLQGEPLSGKKFYEEVINDVSGEKEYIEVSEEKLQNKAWVNDLISRKKLKTVDGKRIVYDGRTGEAFDNPVTVGIMYYLKLHHLVDDKIHARSIGPYALVTQQPLGGKAQFGGQRFGEMEVWALEAYGAAYTLQEMLTIKSDDVTGRTNAYEAIIRGASIPTPGIPESFRVLVKELQALALDINVLDEEGNPIPLKMLSEDIEEKSSLIKKNDFMSKYIDSDNKKEEEYIVDEENMVVEDDESFDSDEFNDEDFDLDFPEDDVFDEFEEDFGDEADSDLE